MKNTIIKTKNITKEYNDKAVLKNINLEIIEGEFVTILGAGSSGKSTLLNIIGGMEPTTHGDIIFKNTSITKLDLDKYHSENIGFVFQNNKLISNFTAVENLEIAIQNSTCPLNINETLDKVGLETKYNKFPRELSGGEQQRLGIARAIVKNVPLILCDEPTSSLDYVTGIKILKLLEDLCINKNTTVILATTNEKIAKLSDKIVKLNNGAIEEIIVNENKVPAERIEW